MLEKSESESLKWNWLFLILIKGFRQPKASLKRQVTQSNGIKYVVLYWKQELVPSTRKSKLTYFYVSAKNTLQATNSQMSDLKLMKRFPHPPTDGAMSLILWVKMKTRFNWHNQYFLLLNYLLRDILSKWSMPFHEQYLFWTELLERLQQRPWTRMWTKTFQH